MCYHQGMNEVRRHRPESDEIAEIGEIVGRHTLPPFVTGYDVTLGIFDDEPAAWIAFHTTGQRPDDPQARRARVDALRQLREAVYHELRNELPERYPYFRYVNVPAE